MFMPAGCIGVDIVFIAGGAFRSNMSNKVADFGACGWGFAATLHYQIPYGLSKSKSIMLTGSCFFDYFLTLAVGIGLASKSSKMEADFCCTFGATFGYSLTTKLDASSVLMNGYGFLFICKSLYLLKVIVRSSCKAIASAITC